MLGLRLEGVSGCSWPPAPPPPPPAPPPASPSCRRRPPEPTTGDCAALSSCNDPSSELIDPSDASAVAPAPAAAAAAARRCGSGAEALGKVERPGPGPELLGPEAAGGTRTEVMEAVGESAYEPLKRPEAEPRGDMAMEEAEAPRARSRKEAGESCEAARWWWWYWW